MKRFTSSAAQRIARNAAALNPDPLIGRNFRVSPRDRARIGHICRQYGKSTVTCVIKPNPRERFSCRTMISTMILTLVIRDAHSPPAGISQRRVAGPPWGTIGKEIDHGN